MKKPFRKLVCAALCLALAFGFSSCGILKNMRENARLASLMTILETPDQKDLADVFNRSLAASAAESKEIGEQVSFSVSRPDVTSDNGSADVLDDCAETLKNMIMSQAPGSSDRNLNGGETADTLLAEIKPADVCAAGASRNEKTENETDENGDDVTDADGNVVTRQATVDNLLKLRLEFYDTVIGTETDENGEEKETRTLVPAADDVILTYFGAAREKDAVLAQFDVLKDYLQVSDYTIAYKDCAVSAELDLESLLADSISYVKNMTVTATAAGVGELAGLGTFTVTLDVCETTSYTFTYGD